MSVTTVDTLDFSASALAPAIPATKAQISSVLRSWPAIMESQETIMSSFRRQQDQINAWEDNFKTLWKHCKDTGTDLITVEKNLQAFDDWLDCLEGTIEDNKGDGEQDVKIESEEDEDNDYDDGKKITDNLESSEEGQSKEEKKWIVLQTH